MKKQTQGLFYIWKMLHVKDGNTKVSIRTVDTDMVVLVVKSAQRLNYTEVWMLLELEDVFVL